MAFQLAPRQIAATPVKAPIQIKAVAVPGAVQIKVTVKA